MPFEDSKDGQTHYQNDGCGCPEHNDDNWDKESQEWQQASANDISKSLESNNMRKQCKHSDGYLCRRECRGGENRGRCEEINCKYYVERKKQ